MLINLIHLARHTHVTCTGFNPGTDVKLTVAAWTHCKVVPSLGKRRAQTFIAPQDRGEDGCLLPDLLARFVTLL